MATTQKDETKMETEHRINIVYENNEVLMFEVAWGGVDKQTPKNKRFTWFEFIDYPQPLKIMVMAKGETLQICVFAGGRSFITHNNNGKATYVVNDRVAELTRTDNVPEERAKAMLLCASMQS